MNNGLEFCFKTGRIKFKINSSDHFLYFYKKNLFEKI